MNLEALASAAVAAFVIMRLIEHIIKPFFERYEWDKFWLPYIAMVIGTGLGYFTGLNAFPVFQTSEWVGRALTCLVIGLGPDFIYDLVDNKPNLSEDVPFSEPPRPENFLYPKHDGC